MLKVTAKDNLFKKDSLEKGMIRVSDDGERVIMIVNDLNSNKLRVLYLYDSVVPVENNDVMDISNADFLLREYPIVVRKTELILSNE